MDVLEIISQVPLFSDLPPEELNRLAGRGERRAYAAGEVVFYAGDLGHRLYFVGSGSVKIHLDREDGEETVFAIIPAGDLFGEMSLLDGQPRSADATCCEPTELAWLDANTLRDCLDRYPHFNRRILERVSRRLREADRQVEVVTALDVYGRVAAQLLDLARAHGVPAAQGTEIRLGLTQQTLAAMVGSSRESVNKAISAFRKRGFIEMDRERILLLNEEELRKRA